MTVDSEIGNRTADTEEAGERSQWDAWPPSRILLVDDNSAIGAITEIMLRTLGDDRDSAACAHLEPLYS